MELLYEQFTFMRVHNIPTYIYKTCLLNLNLFNIYVYEISFLFGIVAYINDIHFDEAWKYYKLKTFCDTNLFVSFEFISCKAYYVALFEVFFYTIIRSISWENMYTWIKSEGLMLYFSFPSKIHTFEIIFQQGVSILQHTHNNKHQCRYIYNISFTILLFCTSLCCFDKKDK